MSTQVRWKDPAKRASKTDGPDKRNEARADPLERLELEFAEREPSQPADEYTHSESPGLEVVQQRERIYRRLLAFADAMALLAAFVVAFPLLDGHALELNVLVLVPVLIVIAKVQGLYDRDELVIRKATLDEFPRLLNLATLLSLGVWLTRHSLTSGNPHTSQLLVLWLTLTSALVFGRMFARGLAGRRAPVERCLVVGDAALLGQLEAKLEGDAHVQLAGVIASPGSDLTVDTLREIARDSDIHRLIIAPEQGTSEQDCIEMVRVAKATGLRVSLFPRIMGAVGSSVVFDDLGGLTLLGVPRFGLTRSSGATKRTLDLVGAGIGLLISAPLMLLAALAIKLDSPGPVFFRQTRVGRGGRRFQMLKLRSMLDGADALKHQLREHNEAEGLFKIVEDPRITHVGRVLRRSHLDELPQLLNVLRGEMSLVGPRPLVVDEDEQITGFDRRRLHLTPGMTGPWQILGPTRVPMSEMVKIDYLYVAHWSLWEDIKIMLQTCGVIFSRKGL